MILFMKFWLNISHCYMHLGQICLQGVYELEVENNEFL